MIPISSGNRPAFGLFRDIFEHITANRLPPPCLVNIFRRGETKAPVYQVVNHTSPPVLVAAGHQAARRRINEAMEVDSAVLVQLRNNNVLQPPARRPIVQPLGQPFHGPLCIIPINFCLVQRQCDEQIQVIVGHRHAIHLALGSSRRPLGRVTVRLAPGSGLARLARLPPRLPKNRTAGDHCFDNFPRHRMGEDTPRVSDKRLRYSDIFHDY